jgi:hypothetical protein
MAARKPIQQRRAGPFGGSAGTCRGGAGARLAVATAPYGGRIGADGRSLGTGGQSLPTAAWTAGGGVELGVFGRYDALVREVENKAEVGS